MEEAFYHGREYYEALEQKVQTYCHHFNIPYQGETWNFWLVNHCKQYVR